MKRLGFILIALLPMRSGGAGTLTADETADATVEAAVVEVLVHYQEPDPAAPWQYSPPRQRRGFGLLLGKGLLVTTENLTRNLTMAEVRRPRSGDKTNARLLQADSQINLALLQLEGHPELKSPPQKGEDPLAGYPLLQPPLAGPGIREAEIVQIDATSEIQRSKARLVRWKVDTLPASSHSALLATLLTDLNIDDEGAPVFSNGNLLGLLISYTPSTRTGQMLPVQAIRDFTADALSPPYDGFASAGIMWQPLVDSTKRRFFDLEQDGRGVQVTGVLPATTGANPLAPNDVILKWDGIALDPLGYYEDPDWGRLLFPHLIKGRRRPGDVIPVTFIRDRHEMHTLLTLVRFTEDAALIPENTAGEPEPFIVEAGLVIRELTGRQLKAAGNPWQPRVNPRLAHLYLTRQFQPEQPGDRIIVLTHVLPDRINIGYQHLRDERVDTVNGTPVRNLQQVFEIIDRDGGIIHLGLRDVGVDLAIDPAGRTAANQRIARQYRLPFSQRRPRNHNLPSEAVTD